MSVVGKPGYKETEAGWIPDDWEATNFGALLSGKPEYGANAAAAEFCGENSVRYIRITDIDEAGRLIETGKKYLPMDEAKDYLLTENDLLIARSGNTVGKSLLFKEDMGRCAFAGYLIRFRMGERLDPKYAAQYLHSDAYWAWVKGSSKVGAQPNINSQQYQGMSLPLPSIPEQQKIAAILTAVDDKLDVIACQIEATQTLKRGLMQTLFSRGVGTQDAEGRWVPHMEFPSSELGEIPVGWEVGCIGDYIAALRSGVSVNGEARPHGEDEVGVLKVGCVFEGRFLPCEHKTVVPEDVARVAEPAKKGSIIISRANTSALVGESAYIDKDWPNLYLPDKLWQTAPSSLPHSVRWLSFYLQSPFAREEISKAATGTSGSMKNIAKPAFLSVPMPLLPLAEQERIADILMAVTSKLDVLSTKQTHYQTLKRGLMQKLLTGEWRVKIDKVTG